MTRRLCCRVPVAASLLLLPALTGCVFHKKSPPPVVAIAPAPEPPPQPLYSSELNQSTPLLPDLPPPAAPNAQPTPPPQSVVEVARKRTVRRGRSRRGETEIAERDQREKDITPTEPPANEGAATPPAGTEPAANVTTQTPAGDSTPSTVIGQLTAGPSEDASVSRGRTYDLIQNTQRGVNSLHRSLSGDQEKTVTQIRSFLQQAQHALHNGDVDGANTLATKAKVLLDELTGSS